MLAEPSLALSPSAVFGGFAEAVRQVSKKEQKKNKPERWTNQSRYMHTAMNTSHHKPATTMTAIRLVGNRPVGWPKYEDVYPEVR
jgi:hypothetical protein